jgi:flagellar hook-basal body complex protein FliE
MYPISAIPSAMPASGIAQRPEIVPSDTLPVPGAGSILAPGQADGVAQAQPSGDSFGSLFSRMVEDVNSSQNAASNAIQSLQSGGNVSLHQAVIAMEEANVSFQLMVEVRNRLLESYQEIMRMQM